MIYILDLTPQSQASKAQMDRQSYGKPKSHVGL